MEYTFSIAPRISLSFRNETIECSAKYQFLSPTNTFRFFLGSGLLVTNVLADKKSIDFEQSKTLQLLYRDEVREVSLYSDNEFSELEISYEGIPSGWCTTINSSIKAICTYSCWYPLLSIQDSVDYMIRVSIEDGFEIVNSTQTEENAWKYGCSGYDTGNILAFNKMHYKSEAAPGIRVLYRHEEEAGMARHMNDLFTHALSYYANDLYHSDTTEEFTILSLGVEECGAYVRKGLIVFPRLYTENGERDFEEAKDEITAILLHEIAHIWCKGADVTSWEDWLNETTAEWSAYLYMIDNDRSDLFIKMITRKIDEYVSFPAIRIPSGERSNGVHHKGTVLLYWLYQRYGIDAIRVLLRSFVSLKIKNTESLISAVRNAIGNDIADSIENGLDLNEFIITTCC
jgi:hypothetical protein